MFQDIQGRAHSLYYNEEFGFICFLFFCLGLLMGKMTQQDLHLMNEELDRRADALQRRSNAGTVELLPFQINAMKEGREPAGRVS